MASFRDRLLTPAGARAITAPSAILLAGLGASVGIVAGLPVAAAAAIGAGAWLVRVALGLPKGAEGPRVDPRRLGEPWAGFVREALDAQVRYRRAIRNARAGAIRERLTEIGNRVDDGVGECWRIASRGNELDLALRQLESPRQLRFRLETLERAGAAGGANAVVAESLRNQMRSTERVIAVGNDARERLSILDARLDEAVARAVELSLRAGDAVELGGLEGDVDALVADMEALRQALDETSGAARPAEST
jgi:hypothetical protein